MSVGLQVWSQTASQNSTADTNINWPEGMAPSQVNDSARATMASMAKWRDDNNGSIVTSGTTVAYTATSNQVEAALTAGYTIAVQFHATNDSSATLAVDGLAAKPLQTVVGTNVSSGAFLVGNIYRFTYSSTGTGQWICNDIVSGPGLQANSIPYGQIQQISAGARLLGTTSTSTGLATNVGEVVIGNGLTISTNNLSVTLTTPSFQTFTSTTTTTYATPTDAKGNLPMYLRVRMVGGGGGGGAAQTNSGSSGTDTTFSNWTAIAGAKGIASAAGGAGGSGGVNGTGTVITRVSGAGGNAGNNGISNGPGTAGGNSFFGGCGSAAAIGVTGNSAAANSGSGGGGGGNGTSSAGGGGGAGEYVEFFITSPSSLYAVAVGGGGAGGLAGNTAGGAGGSGRIEVTAYWQ